MSDDPHRRQSDRLARNEAMFREVNERLRELGESFSLVSRRASFVCECSDVECTEPVELTLEQYARVRSEPLHFVLLKGHERPELEFAAYELPPYLVVQKRDDLADAVDVGSPA